MWLKETIYCKDGPAVGQALPKGLNHFHLGRFSRGQSCGQPHLNSVLALVWLGGWTRDLLRLESDAVTDSISKIWSRSFPWGVFYGLIKPAHSTKYNMAVPDPISSLFTPQPLVYIRFGLLGITQPYRA